VSERAVPVLKSCECPVPAPKLTYITKSIDAPKERGKRERERERERRRGVMSDFQELHIPIICQPHTYFLL